MAARSVNVSRADLCTLGREYMLAAHLQDRGAMPVLLRDHSMDEAFAVAIEEWMTASPIYTRRMQRLLGFEGDGVDTIFKGLQLDVGFPHQFMDVGYELHDRTRGEFWLVSCGALRDVMPMGEAFVHGMCHTIEDPTFDATAVATNARARVRPLHRPPGVPRGGPECHWTVAIDADAAPAQPHPRLPVLEASVLAALPNDPVPAYAGPFNSHFELEDLSQAALQTVVREFALQGHLLARACMLAVDRQFGPGEAVAVGRAIFGGIAWIAAERIARVFGDDLGRVIGLTPLVALHDYTGLDVDAEGDALTISLRADAVSFDEGDSYSLAGLLRDGADEIVEALVHGADPSTAVEVTTPPAGAVRAWRVTRSDDVAAEPGFVRVMRFSAGPATVLFRRRPIPS